METVSVCQMLPEHSVNEAMSDVLKMAGAHDYVAIEPSRSEIDALPGPVLLEFGSPWCGYCLRAKPLIEKALEHHALVRHIKIADASRRRLGRSFGVKLWPTLVCLKDGKEVARFVRPRDADPIRQALAEIDPP
jgi:thioredoxin 1